MANNLSPRMYVIMRNDLASMVPGRACAQATHAANNCITYIKESRCNTIIGLVEQWERETTQFFGTTIVLGASIDQIREIESKLPVNCYNASVFHKVVHDPEYAVRDGDTVHLISLDTCMWIFGQPDQVNPYTEHLKLY